MNSEWTGTKQQSGLKRCPFCGTVAMSQVRLATNDTGMVWRVGCGNPFCGVEPNTPPHASLDDAEAAWNDRASLENSSG